VISGAAITERLELALGVFPELRLVHVHRPVEDALPHLMDAARRHAVRLTPRAGRALWHRRLEECLAAEQLVDSERVLRIDYDRLARRPEETLARCLALAGKPVAEQCVWPLRLLATALPGAPPALRPLDHPRPRRRRRTVHDGGTARRPLRRLVEAVIPERATVLVVSRGDDELLRYADRTGTHFPQLPDGTWAGFYPVDGDAAVDHLRQLVAAGASHLVFPRAALWWLDHYRELREYLEESARPIACDTELAVIFELGVDTRLVLPATLSAKPEQLGEPENARAFTVEQRTPPPARPRKLGGSLWALTTFYNPAGYRSKKENYEHFRRGLGASGVPLLTIELAFGDAPFALADGDADVVVRLRGGDVLWQKERLLNIGVRRLPDDCDKVAWLDADVLFSRRDWAHETGRLLERYVAVQPFSHSVRLPQHASSCEPAMLPFGSQEGQLFYGIAWGVQAKGRRSLASYDRHGHTGFAWAARRSVLEQHGLYEANLLGNGDSDIAHAMFGNSRYWALQKLGEHSRAHLRRWAEPFSAAVGGSVAHVDGVVSHLWHGETEHRLYDRPLDVLHALDPDRHLVADGPDGLLRFTDSAPPELRAWSTDYFSSRREDG
jgi:hypothetical protein